MAYSAMTKRAAGYVVPASEWNQLIDNDDYLKAETLDAIALAADGWIPASGTWTYASSTTITVPSGAASIYSVGDRIKITQTTVKYFYIVAVADTLLTVTGGSTYTVANATITNPYFSKVLLPVSFPHHLPYTPTGVAGSNVTLTGRFSVMGRKCHVQLQCYFTGGITFTTMPTLPITASASEFIASSLVPAGVGGIYDASVGWAALTIIPIVPASSTTVTIAKASDCSSISATNPITWANGDLFYVKFDYEI